SAQSASASATTQSNPDTTAPTVSITSPSAGQISGAITVSASAVDPTVAGQVTSGLAGVQFKLDGSNLGLEDTAFPYSVSLDTTTLTNGSHSITATARDNAGNQASSAAVAVTVYNLANATRYPRKFALTSLEALSTIPANQVTTAFVLSGTTVLETQSNLAADVSGNYTVSFLAADPQMVDIRVSASGYLSRKFTSIDTTVNSALVMAVPMLLAGDFNSDNTINSLDYSLINTHWLENYPAADINRDGLVNTLDYAVMKNNYNKSGE
ncbi:MAG: Ig-like domain-containing protein, partial [Patescibacteria group bacterium]